MAITILAPAPASIPFHLDDDSSEDSDHGGVNLEGDAGMPRVKRARHPSKDIVTPGETVTDDPQWMRYSAPLLFLFDPLLTRLQRPRYIHRTFEHRNQSHRRGHRSEDEQASFGPAPASSVHPRNR